MKYIHFDKASIGKELKLGIPIALQEFLVGISFIIIQTVVNSIDIIASASVGVAEKVCVFYEQFTRHHLVPYRTWNTNSNNCSDCTVFGIYGIFE